MELRGKFDLTPSGAPPMAAGAKHAFGLVLRPEQMVELLHDFVPNAPIPFDARHTGLGIEDTENKIRFYFESFINPLENCLEMSTEDFLGILKRAADGLIPVDAELEGIEISDKFTVMLLRIRSDKFPPHPGDDLPLAHLRYEAGELVLMNPFDALRKDRRTQLSDKR